MIIVVGDNANRRHRGAQTQNTVAAWFRTRGWPNAESAGAGRPGTDVLGVAGWDIEVKARRDFRPVEQLRQLGRRGGANGAVVLRPDGMGPATVGQWPVFLTLDQFTQLLLGAGYGDPGAGQEAL